jgi:arsenate reductase
MIKIYHNSSCTKSCIALAALTKNGEQFEVINYLENVPTVEELRSIIAKLQCKPHDIIRTKEKIYLTKFEGKNLNDEEWIVAMHENPILIQRPIIVKDNFAVIGRSEDALDEII